MFGTAWSAQRSFWSSSTAMMIPLTLQPSRHDSHQGTEPVTRFESGLSLSGLNQYVCHTRRLRRFALGITARH